MNKPQSFDVLDPNLDLTKSYFIEASAGSGKTFCIEKLVQRFFLDAKIPIERILIVTFTNKAKEELDQRIFDQLDFILEDKAKQWTTHFPSLQSSKIIEQVSSILQAQKFPVIETLHSFCVNQAQNFGVISSKEIANDQFEDFLHFLTYERTSLSAVQILLALKYASNDYYQLYMQMKRSKSFFKIEARDLKNAVIDFQQSISAETLLEDLLAMSVNFSGILNRKGEVKEQVHKKLLNFCNLFLTPVDQKTVDDLVFYGNVALLLFAKPKVHQKQVKLHDEKLFEKLKTLSSALDPHRLESFLMATLQQDFQNFLLVKNMPSIDQFMNLFAKSLDAKLVKQIQEQFDVVLIDEFQDTDQNQWEIFSKIFLSNTQMIVVGDPKQSIYGFRNADLYAYQKAKKAFEDERILPKNFRTARKLVEPLNHFFSLRDGILWFPKEQSVLPFRDVIAVREDQHASCTCLFAASQKTKAANEELLFSSLLHFIQKHEDVPLEQIAVIVKDRHQGAKLNRFLKMQNIATQFSFDILLRDIEVFEQIYLFVQALIDGDVFGFKTFLTKSLFGITKEQLHLFSTNGLITAFLSLRQTFFHEGLLATIYQLKNLDHFHFDAIKFQNALLIGKFIEKKVHEQSLSTIEIPLALKSSAGEYINKKEGDHGVEIITNHRAKGLEFDVVFFLAGYGQMPRLKDGVDDTLLLEMQAEKLRNLYVGLTRAKNHLYFAYVPSKMKQLETSSLLDFYYAFTTAQSLKIEDLKEAVAAITPKKLKEHYEQIPGIDLCSIDSLFDSQPKKAGEKKLKYPTPFNYRKQAVALTSFSMETRDLVIESKKIESEEPVGVDVGKLFHEIIEQIFNLGLYVNADILKIQDVIERVVPDKLEHLKTPLLLWVNRVLEMNFEIDNQSIALSKIPPKDLFCELEFLTFQSGTLVKGFVDLIFIYQQKIYIVDWKTNLLEGYEKQHLMKEMQSHQYILQAKMYMEAVSKIKQFQSFTFGKAIYVFVRGLHPDDCERGTAIFHPNEEMIPWN